MAGFILGAASIALVMIPAMASACGGSDQNGPRAGLTIAATAQATEVPATPAERAAALCALPAPSASVSSRVLSPDVREISGIVASRTQPGVLWAHNDSGDTARLFVIGDDGRHLATFTLAGADATDWEDMAIGPGPTAGIDYLYVGDIGDNMAVRPAITVYRVEEPPVVASAVAAVDLGGVEAFTLSYPDRAHDAETLIIDPTNGDLMVVTKEIVAGVASVYSAPAPLIAGAETTLTKVAEFDLREYDSSVEVPSDAPPLVNVGWVPTAGDVSPDGDVVAIRTYSTVWVWPRSPGAPLWDAFASPPCEAPSIIEQQGEAIAFDATGSGYFTLSEGADPQLHYFAPE